MAAWLRITLLVGLSLIIPFVLLITMAPIVGESIQTQVIAASLVPINTPPIATTSDSDTRLHLLDVNSGTDLQIQLSSHGVIDVYPLDAPGEVLLLSNETAFYEFNSLTDIVLQHLDLDDGGITPIISLKNLENYTAILRFINGNYRPLTIQDELLGLHNARQSNNPLYTYDMKTHEVLGQFTLGDVIVLFPHWSPDSQHISLMNQGDLLIYSINGELEQTVPIGFPFDDAAWSDDGSQILLSVKYSNITDGSLPLTIVDYPAGQVNDSLPRPLADQAQWVCDRVLYVSAEDHHLRLLGSETVDPALDEISILAFYPSADCNWVLFTARNVASDGALAPVSRLSLYVVDTGLQKVRQITDAGVVEENLFSEDGFFYRVADDSGGESLVFERWDGAESYVAANDLPDPSFRLVSINQFGLIYQIRTANFTNALIVRDLETGAERYLTDPQGHVLYYALW